MPILQLSFDECAGGAGGTAMGGGRRTMPLAGVWHLSWTPCILQAIMAIHAGDATRRQRAYNSGPEPVPRKIRELIRDLERAGFVDRGGKDSHRNFEHPKVAKSVVLAGKEGNDAKQYQERDVKRAIKDSQS